MTCFMKDVPGNYCGLKRNGRRDGSGVFSDNEDKGETKTGNRLDHAGWEVKGGDACVIQAALFHGGGRSAGRDETEGSQPIV
jgi:hypothetical protein